MDFNTLDMIPYVLTNPHVPIGLLEVKQWHPRKRKDVGRNQRKRRKLFRQSNGHSKR